MSTRLRLAFVAITASLLGTLVWISPGDLFDGSGPLSGASSWLESLTDWLNRPDVSGSSRDGPVQCTSPNTAWQGPSPRTPDRAELAGPKLAGAPQTPTQPLQAPNVHQSEFLHVSQPAIRPASNEETGPKDNCGNLVVAKEDISHVLALLGHAAHRKILTSPGVKGIINLDLPNTTADEAFENILKAHGYVARTKGDYTIVYTPEELDKVEQRELKSIRIYKPQNISAADLEELLRDQVSQGAKISKTRASQVGVQSNGDQAGGDSLAVPDMVVVQDIEPVLKELDRIFAEVDVPAPQVLIESVLLSVRLDNEHQMGVNLALLLGNSGLAASGNGATLKNSAGFAPLTAVGRLANFPDQFAGNGLKFGVIRGDFTSFVKLLETVGHTTILANPKVLTLNKQRAEIQVGSQLGYKTITTSETATVESVQFLDVGTQLRVRPFVQPNGRIRMEIHPEKSSGKVDSVTQLPSKDTSQVTTNMTVPSGTTVVIGGLIEEQQQRTVQQIPLLGSVPLIGGLFRDQTTSTTRSELIVLITPRIMSDDDLAEAACTEQDRFEGRRQGLKDSFPQHTRTALARRYYEKACACYDQGDTVAALDLTEVSLHFDPFYDLARNLRDKLLFPPEDRSAAMK